MKNHIHFHRNVRYLGSGRYLYGRQTDIMHKFDISVSDILLTKFCLPNVTHD